MPYIKAARWRRIQERLKAKSEPKQNFTELREAVQQDVKRYNVQDIMQFAYSVPEIATAKHPYGGQAFQVADSQYFIPTETMLHRVLRETEVDTIDWVAEKTDCEDIAKYFAALVSVKLGFNAIGIACSADGGHAFSFSIARTQRDALKIIWFEPQTDRILQPSDLKGVYQLGPKRASFTL